MEASLHLHQLSSGAKLNGEEILNLFDVDLHLFYIVVYVDCTHECSRRVIHCMSAAINLPRAKLCLNNRPS